MTNLSTEHSKLIKENQDKDERIVKTYADYMETYEALLKLRNEKSEDGNMTKSISKKSKKKKTKNKEIFDDLIDNNDKKAPRNSVTKPASRLSYAEFNMSGGNTTYDSDESENRAIIKELEDENKRLQSLIEYKDYEINKYK